MEDFVTHRGFVYPWDCDHLGHMNNAKYAAKFDEASWNLMLRIGISPAYLRDVGCGLASVEQVTTFQRELVAGDVIEVRSTFLEVREKTMRCLHKMLKAETGEVAATCAIVGVHIDLKARKSCPLPEALRRAAERFAMAQAA